MTMIGDTGLPVVVLKMRNNVEKSCPFVTSRGCTIYPDRPWSCRIYPLQPESTKITEKAGREYYSVMDVPFCLGFAEDNVQTFDAWIVEQGIPIYKEMEAPFKKITTNEFLPIMRLRIKRSRRCIISLAMTWIVLDALYLKAHF